MTRMHTILVVACIQLHILIALAQSMQPTETITKVELLVGCSLVTQPWLQQATLAYQLVSPNVTINPRYDLSSVTQPLVLTGQLDLGLFSSSSFLTAAQKVQFPDILQAPLVGVAAVPIYNVPGIPVGSAPIQFTQKVLAKIMRANITKWNHPELVALNPTLSTINQNITVIIGAKYSQSLVDVFMRWLCKGDAKLATTIGCTAATYDPTKVPTLKFQPALKSAESVLYVSERSYSLGFTTLVSAAQAGLNVANLVNSAGLTIVPNLVSSQLPIFERALELDALGNSDLTSATGPNAWPMVQFQFLQFSGTFTRKNCQTRVELAKFITWLFTDPVSISLAEQVSMVILPALISDALGIPVLLQQSIQCDGVPAYPDSSASSGVISGGAALGTMMPYLFQFYATTIEKSLAYIWKGDTWENSQRNVQQGNVDAILQISRGALSQDAFYSLPLFATGLQAIFKLPDAVLAYEGLLPLIIDVDTLAAIFSAKIQTWLDPRIVQFNPLLPLAIADAGMDPKLGVVICCQSQTDPLAATNLFMGALKSSVVLDESLQTYPIRFDKVFTATTTVEFSYAEDELDLTSLTSANVGYIGYRSLQSTQPTDINTVFKLVPWTGVSNQASILATEGTIVALAANESITASTDSILDCFRGPLRDSTTNPNAIFDFSRGVLDLLASNEIPLGCYPLARLINVIVPNSFSGLSCVRGNKTLNLIQWLGNTRAISPATNAAGFALLTDLDNILDAFNTKLNSITCDGSTMLVRQPTVWKMSEGVSSVGLALSISGVIICIVTGILLFFLRDRSVFRSSSVLFLFLTLIGIILMFLSALLWSIQTPTDMICRGFTITSQLGFTLTFAPLFIKTWRIWYIFERRQLKVVKISNLKLSSFVGIAVLFDIIVLIIWDQRAPIRTVMQEIDSTTSLWQYTHCAPSSDATVYFWLLNLSKIISLLFGACIGFATRNVVSTFNESKNVAMSIWNVFFTILVLVPIMLLLDTVGDALIGIVLFLVLWVCIGTFFFMYVNKFLSLPEWKNWTNDTMTGGGSSAAHQPLTSTGGFSFLSVNTLGTDTLVRYIAECEKHMSAAKKLFLKLGGHQSFFQSLHYLDPIDGTGEPIKPQDARDMDDKQDGDGLHSQNHSHAGHDDAHYEHSQTGSVGGGRDDIGEDMMLSPHSGPAPRRLATNTASTTAAGARRVSLKH